MRFSRTHTERADLLGRGAAQYLVYTMEGYSVKGDRKLNGDLHRMCVQVHPGSQSAVFVPSHHASW